MKNTFVLTPNDLTYDPDRKCCAAHIEIINSDYDETWYCFLDTNVRFERDDPDLVMKLNLMNLGGHSGATLTARNIFLEKNQVFCEAYMTKIPVTRNLQGPFHLRKGANKLPVYVYFMRRLGENVSEHILERPDQFTITVILNEMNYVHGYADYEELHFGHNPKQGIGENAK